MRGLIFSFVVILIATVATPVVACHQQAFAVQQFVAAPTVETVIAQPFVHTQRVVVRQPVVQQQVVKQRVVAPVVRERVVVQRQRRPILQRRSRVVSKSVVVH